jgi:2-polyprenyl-3-methyl-5-hydroxy-6-metoxy-1,4-benzoquinol methylase
MFDSYLEFLKNPNSKKNFSIKNQTFENNQIKSGILVDTDGIEYKIVDFIPRFVNNDSNNKTSESFSFKWKTYVNSAIEKQEENKRIFLEHYGWQLDDFKTFLSTRQKILDVGCGVGYVSNWISLETNGHVFGVDLSSSVDEAQRIFNSKQNLQYIQADIAELPFNDAFFDLIVCKEMIHHTPEPRKNFSKLVKLLRPGGIICVYVYNKKGPIREFCDDYLRDFTTKLTEEECQNFAVAMTEFGKSLRELKTTINVPLDIPYLNIKAGNYDLQRFLYWNIFKCWWDDNGNKEYSNAINFDWYHPPYAFRYTEDEIKNWFSEEDIEIENFNMLESGFAIRGKKS